MKKIQDLISEMIASEVHADEIDNGHGITKENLHEHVMTPKLQTYFDPMNESITNELWTVLEEQPTEKKGYTIFWLFARICG